jgi:23S rRNA maturation-related 3'-5' exoribonuclease YhaM
MKSDIFNKELSYIKSDRLRESERKLLDLLPDYFYEIPASSTGKYHPSFSLGNGGLVRHTKVAVRIASELFNNNALFTSYNNDEKDLLIMSLLLHDGLKEGIVKEKYTRFDHPLLVANLIKENADKINLTSEEINIMVESISSHMGPWNTNEPYSSVVLPIPKTKYEQFVHMCDYLSSRKFLDVKFDDNDDIVE